MPRGQKVAIVHDWLIGGGAELVVEQLHKLYPDAPIYTSYCTDEWQRRLDNKVVTGWLQHLGRLRKYIPYLRIWWFSRLDLREFDLIISSTGAEAKGLKKLAAHAKHVSYIHAPTHYYWSRYDGYMKHPGFGAFDWLARIGLKLLVNPLRKWDYRAAQRPHYLIANSTHTQSEIKKYYNRVSVVVHPPVYIERFQETISSDLRRGFIISGRQTPYKRFDIAIQACSKLRLPLTVLGDGPDNKRLKSLAGPSVSFLGQVTDEILEQHFAAAEALIFPGIDDFGITAVEALAAGTPVIAYKAGGALDYVIEGKSGVFFEGQTAQSLTDALKHFNAQDYTTDDIKAVASNYSREAFQEKLQTELNRVLQ